jgi:hypothetical protein
MRKEGALADLGRLAPPIEGVVEAMSNEELAARLDRLFRLKAAIDGLIIEVLGEVEGREAYREEGAVSADAWAAERYDLSVPSARVLVQVATKAGGLPCLVGALQAGEISFDQLRAVADVATAETDRELRDRARECSVRELAELARSRRDQAGGGGGDDDARRRSLRFSDPFRTVTVQLPRASYAETRAILEGRARELPTDGETPWDQRLCDAFLLTLRAGPGTRETSDSRYFVVAHVPLEVLIDEESTLAGELERDGFISAEVVRQIACDATFAVAVDDDVGHTMYEGRARRWPTDAQRREIMRRDRHCRFPGCTNVTFTNVHHIRQWKPERGRTDLDNLALLCVHHHGVVHRGAWTMSGDANAELTFVGPTGRAMRSRPSPMWTAATSPAARRAAGRPAEG